MAVLQAWCSAVILAAVCGTMAAGVVPSVSHSQDLIIGLVGQQWSSSEAREGVDDALDDINNITDHELLSGYRLKYFHYGDSILPGTSSEVIASAFF